MINELSRSENYYTPIKPILSSALLSQRVAKCACSILKFMTYSTLALTLFTVTVLLIKDAQIPAAIAVLGFSGIAFYHFTKSPRDLNLGLANNQSTKKIDDLLNEDPTETFNKIIQPKEIFKNDQDFEDFLNITVDRMFETVDRMLEEKLALKKLKDLFQSSKALK